MKEERESGGGAGGGRIANGQGFPWLFSQSLTIMQMVRIERGERLKRAPQKKGEKFFAKKKEKRLSITNTHLSARFPK